MRTAKSAVRPKSAYVLMKDYQPIAVYTAKYLVDLHLQDLEKVTPPGIYHVQVVPFQPENTPDA